MSSSVGAMVEGNLRGVKALSASRAWVAFSALPNECSKEEAIEILSRQLSVSRGTAAGTLRMLSRLGLVDQTGGRCVKLASPKTRDEFVKMVRESLRPLADLVSSAAEELSRMGVGASPWTVYRLLKTKGVEASESSVREAIRLLRSFGLAHWERSLVVGPPESEEDLLMHALIERGGRATVPKLAGDCRSLGMSDGQFKAALLRALVGGMVAAPGLEWLVELWRAVGDLTPPAAFELEELVDAVARSTGLPREEALRRTLQLAESRPDVVFLEQQRGRFIVTLGLPGSESDVLEVVLR